MTESGNNNKRTFTNLLVSALSSLHSGEGGADSIEEFLEGIRELFQVAGVLWWELDPNKENLFLTSFAGPFDSDIAGLSIPATEGFAGAVLEYGTPQVLEGTALTSDLPEAVTKDMEVETALGICVGQQEESYGMLITLFPSGASLALQQMETVQLLAAELGRALGTRRLSAELSANIKRMELLQGLSQILQSDEPIDKRLHHHIEALTAAFDASYGHILLFDENERVLRFRASSGIALEKIQHETLQPGSGIIGKVYESGQSILAADVLNDSDYIEGYPGVRSEMAVPIEAEGVVIGVLNLESDKPGAFDPVDLRMAAITASQTGTTLRHALAYDAAIYHLKELELLNRVTQAITTTDDVDELLQSIVDEIHFTLEVTSVAILLIEPDGIEMRVHAVAGDHSKEISQLKLRVGRGATGVAAMEGLTQYLPDVTRDERYVPVDPNIRCELAVPLVNKGSVVGVLNLESTSLNAFSKEDRHVVEIVAAQIAQILAKALLYDELATMAATDGLTGLFNHRQFFVRLEAEFKRATRYTYPLSMIMLDIDFFKNFNDTYGHMQGDKVLQEIASIITQTMRETDVVARYGGEEFAVILPLCHESTAMEVAERLRTSIEHANLGGQEESSPLTISVGLCSAPKDASTFEELVKRADDAMYHSKRMGRNKCTIWRSDIAGKDQ
jgi:diguanylate cyclase (GGDEF)-like protein